MRRATAPTSTPTDVWGLKTKARCLAGSATRATVRMTGVAKNTVVKLMVGLGRACDEYQRQTLVNLRSRRIQCDEIWSSVYAKERNADPKMKAARQAGDIWTWVAFEADSKLAVSRLVGGRDAGYAAAFMDNVASRLATRVQLTTDGHKVHVEAVEGPSVRTWTSPSRARLDAGGSRCPSGPKPQRKLFA